MEAKKLPELDDEELLLLAKKMKRDTIYNALIIGFLMGIIVFSIFNRTFGLLMIIPIYLVYKLINKPKYDKNELEKLLKERNSK
jgi:hypothetical protein